jgi:dTDP-4-dehydrorhamnose 3,5-epimerase
LLDLVKLSKKKIIDVPGGDVMHILKNSDKVFQGFGEAYFSLIDPQFIKAWKMHTKMNMNLIVPVGSVKFVIAYQDHSDIFHFREEILSKENYALLTIPAGFWVGFKGEGAASSLVLNIADIPHDPDEIERLNVDDIKYNWESAT